MPTRFPNAGGTLLVSVGLAFSHGQEAMRLDPFRTGAEHGLATPWLPGPPGRSRDPIDGRSIPAIAQQRGVHLTIGVRCEDRQEIELVKARDASSAMLACHGSSRGAPRGAGTGVTLRVEGYYHLRCVRDRAGGEAHCSAPTPAAPRGSGDDGAAPRDVPGATASSVRHAGAHAGHDNAQRLAGDSCERPHSVKISPPVRS